jgi:hypothetical protein
MNENVRTIIPSYKAISLRIVKPFHFANHLALLLRVVRAGMKLGGQNEGKSANQLGRSTPLTNIASESSKVRPDSSKGST